MEYFILYNRYYVCKSGLIFTKAKKRYLHPVFGGCDILKGLITNVGYIQFWLINESGQGKWYKLHSLLMNHYKPNESGLKLEIDHINRDKTDNRLDNLRWVTHKENCANRDFSNVTYDWNKGKKASKEVKQKMSDAKKGKLHPKFKGYYVNNGVRYDSAMIAAKAFKTSNSQIIRFAKNKRNGWIFEPIN